MLNETRNVSSSSSGSQCIWKTTSFSTIKAKNARRRRLEIQRLKSETLINSDANDEITKRKRFSGVDSSSIEWNFKSGSEKSQEIGENQASETSLSYSSSPGSSSDRSTENESNLDSLQPPGNESEKISEKLNSTVYGSVSVIGRRREMEDAISAELGFVDINSEKFDLFAVFDGHGGARVAQACREELYSIVAKEIEEESANMPAVGVVEERERKGFDWERVMAKSFGKMDEEVAGEDGDRVAVAAEVSIGTMGSTAVVAVVGKREIVVASCGDSRAVISRDGVFVPLTNDHKPDRPDELERIEAAGGRVINWNGHRVLGVLATSRSIGDHYLKPFITSQPEVTICERTDADEFLILATDGLWDVVSNEVACQVVRRCLDGHIWKKSKARERDGRPSEAAAMLAELAMARGSKDNISVIVVELTKRSSSSFCHKEPAEPKSLVVPL
ncbi:PPM-type phosphatase-like domain [Dillenia turbinata]|uniref:protein-serine/threonine phosphatase n=1 Tax=Dillenia turbinata TaxID=194707 RepID=A0AAN8Z5T4_9MAGN